MHDTMRACGSHPFIKTNKTNLGAYYVLKVVDLQKSGAASVKKQQLTETLKRVSLSKR